VVLYRVTCVGKAEDPRQPKNLLSGSSVEFWKHVRESIRWYWHIRKSI